MSWVGLTAIIILIAAALLGLVLFGLHRGRIGRGAALVMGLVIVAAASVTLLYPSALTLTHEGTEHAAR